MRYLTSEIKRLLLEESKMAFIAGPRQVGKTTLAKSLLPSSAGGYFNWDVQGDQKILLRDPSHFWARAPLGENKKPRIVLDEIHKYPRWKRFLKGHIDQNRELTETIVTGSGRLDVYQRGGDSLFGRYGLYRLHPFTLGEMVNPSGIPVGAPEDVVQKILHNPLSRRAGTFLEHLERWTGFPEPLFGENDRRLQRWRRDHRRLVIREDLRDLTQIREIGLVENLLFLLPERVGSPLSINALSGDLRVTFPTVSNWLSALARLYYLFEIRPFSGHLARTLRREGKVYLFDFGEVGEPGSRFENSVALHLLKTVDAWNDWGFGDFSLHYVRDKEHREVDFLITQSRRPFCLVECKLADTALAPSLVYFRDAMKPKWSFQVVRQASANYLTDYGQNTYVVSASRFLSNF